MSGTAAAASAATRASLAKPPNMSNNNNNSNNNSHGGKNASKYLRVRPYLIEVAGTMEDATVKAITKKLRAMHNRYFPILRTMYTLAASPISETELFGGIEESSTSAEESHGHTDRRSNDQICDEGKGGWLRRPRWAISGNRTHCIVSRLHHSSPTTGPTTHHSGDQRHNCSSEAAFEDFATYRFLPHAITHNFFSLSPVAKTEVEKPASGCTYSFGEESFQSFTRNDVGKLILRHYVHESSRTASFLVADAESMQAVLIDPSGYSLALYEADLARLGLSLGYIVVTHCFVDLALCVDELRAAHPSVRVLSGVEAFSPASPEGHRDDHRSRHGNERSDFPYGFRVRSAGERQDITIGPSLSLSLITVPSFSPESQMVELRLKGTLIAIFSGTAWGTDAAPRADLFEAFEDLQAELGGGCRDAEGGHSDRESAQTTASAANANSGFSLFGVTSTPPQRLTTSTPTVEDTALQLADVDNRTRFYSSPDAMRVAQRNLKTHFYDRYLFPAPLPESSEAQAEEKETAQRTGEPEGAGNALVSNGESNSPRLPGAEPHWRDAGAQPNNTLSDHKGRYDRVVLFPSHGGYSNVSNQLDLYWAIHLGDLKRMRHARVVVDTLVTPEAYCSYARKLPSLPRPPLFQTNRRRNLVSLLSAASSVGLPSHSQSALPMHQPPQISGIEDARGSGVNRGSGAVRPQIPSFSPYPPIVIDTRDAPEYHAVHPRGAVNVPFSFPGAAYGAKRAELWLQCLILPTQPVMLVVKREGEKQECVQRLRTLSPLSTAVAAFTVEELLLCPSSVPNPPTALCTADTSSTLPAASANGGGIDASRRASTVEEWLSRVILAGLKSTARDRNADGDATATGAVQLIGDEAHFTAPVPFSVCSPSDNPNGREGVEAEKERRTLLACMTDGVCSGDVKPAYALKWVACSSTDRKFIRVDAPEKLSALDPNHRQRQGGNDKRQRRKIEEGTLADHHDYGGNGGHITHAEAERSPVTLVVDVRTPYEFKQGSHYHSVHLPLSDLCNLTADATRTQARQAALRRLRGRDANPQHETLQRHCKSGDREQSAQGSVALAKTLFGTLLESAIVSELLPAGATLEAVDGIAVYCAGGYRSLIAASLLRRARETAVDIPTKQMSIAPPATSARDEEAVNERITAEDACTPVAAERSPHDSFGDAESAAFRQLVGGIPIVDVAGGAFAIMTHRPDLWNVKDRSIICIS